MNVNGCFVWKSDVTPRKNHFLLPRSIRAVCIGRSGQGKTTLLTFLLLNPNTLDYTDLYVYGKSLNQPEYKVLQAGFEKGLSKDQVRILFEQQDKVKEEGGLEKVLKDFHGDCPHSIKPTFSSDISSICDPSLLDETKKNLVIFDDLLLSPQNNIEKYYCRARHNNCDSIYLSQSYFRLPRTTIRENSNFYMIFPQDSKNLSHIYRDLCATDGIDYKVFEKFCTTVWSKKYNFVTIDLSKPCNLGKYRQNLGDYWIPKYDRLYAHIQESITHSDSDSDTSLVT